MILSYSLHVNDVIWLICKLGAKARIFLQITKTSMNYDEKTKQISQLCTIFMAVHNFNASSQSGCCLPK